MTLKTLREELEWVRDKLSGDPEHAHAQADKLLMAYVTSKGGNREGILVEKVWDEIPMWYA